MQFSSRSSRCVGLVASALLWFASACSNGGADATTSTLSSTEASLADAEDSLDAARSEASACFETYRACAAATDADVEACRSALHDCLPAAPPAPICDRADDADGGVPQEAEPHPRHARGDGGCERDDDAGLPPEGRGARGHHGHHGLERGHHGCHRPDVSHDDLAGCREAAEAALASGVSEDEAQVVHDACVASAFADHIADLCAKATELCDQADAPAEACERITSACDGATTSP